LRIDSNFFLNIVAVR